MADGSITFDTSVDTKGINKASTMITASFKRMNNKIKSAFGLETVDKAAEKVTKLQQKYDDATETVQRLSKELNELYAQQEKLVNPRDDFNEPAEAQPYIAQAERLKAQLEEAKQKSAEINSAPEPMGKNAIKEHRAEQAKWSKEVDSLNEKYQRVLDKIQLIETKAATNAENKRVARLNSVNAKIAKTEQQIVSLKEKANSAKASLNGALDEKKVSRFSDTLKGASSHLKNFGKRLKSTLKSALIFSVLYKALNKLKELLSSMTKQDTEIATTLGNIKGNLLTAFQPIYEYCLPALQALLNALEEATAFMAQFTASLFGKSVSQMQKNAKALNSQAKATTKAGKAAKEATKSLLGLDEINQLSDNSSSGAGSSAGAASFDNSIDELDGNMAKIASYGSLLLGTALLIFGIATISIPAILAGIALIAAGLKVGEGTGAFEDTPMWLRQIMTWGTILLGAGLMIMGITSIPPNPTLIVAGAAMMGIGVAYGASSGAFDAMPTWLTQILTWGSMLAGVGLLIYGFCTQNPLAIGAGLAAIGIGIAVGFGSGIFSDIWESLKQFFSNVWTALCDLGADIATWWNTNIAPAFTKEYWTTKLNNIKAKVAELWDNIKKVFSPAIDWFSSLFGSVKQTISDVFYNIGVIASGCWEIIKAIWGAVSTWFNEYVVGPVSNFFTTMWGSLKAKATEAWEGIKSTFSPVVEWFEEKFNAAWTAVKNVFSAGGKIFDGIKEGITEAFKAVVNAIITGINKVVAIPFSGINKALDRLRNINIAGISPFTELRNISVPQIPKLATGTVVPKNFGEFAAILGDNKRETEVVSPLSTMKQAFKEAMSESSGAGGGDWHIYVMMPDGTISGEAIITAVQRLNQKNGRTVIPCDA